MKNFLLAFVALSALQFTAHAAPVTQNPLIPADQLAVMDGFNTADSTDIDDSAIPLPPPHHPVPPPHPHPHPYPQPHPYPHPVPPPYPTYWYECSAQDGYGYIYTERGENPVYTQRNIHVRCEEHSGTYCSDLGCRRY